MKYSKEEQEIHDRLYKNAMDRSQGKGSYMEPPAGWGVMKTEGQAPVVSKHTESVNMPKNDFTNEDLIRQEQEQAWEGFKTPSSGYSPVIMDPIEVPGHPGFSDMLDEDNMLFNLKNNLPLTGGTDAEIDDDDAILNDSGEWEDPRSGELLFRDNPEERAEYEKERQLYIQALENRIR